ncbi:hypothetical protein LY90DRAFT_521482, partial [Neocallimastix californiae]
STEFVGRVFSLVFPFSLISYEISHNILFILSMDFILLIIVYKSLPRYVIPSYFIRIDVLPITSTGKLDRKALPESNINDIIKKEYVEPDTEMERIICEIYERLFKLEENTVGKYSYFYDLGGNSLNAIKVVRELEKKFKFKVGIKDILKYSVVSNLSEHV